MSRRSLTRIGAGLAAALVLLAACDDDPINTAPTIDDEAPSVTITDAPDESPAMQDVTVSFTVTDGVALADVACSWGVPDTPPDLFDASGATYSASATYRYEQPGDYTIVIRATDAAGNEATASHEITVGGPLPSAPTDVSVSMDGNSVTVDWTPGVGATSQEVVLFDPVGLGVHRVIAIADGSTASVTISDLSWSASYGVMVFAINENGRSDGAGVPFEVRAPDPPVLTRFSAVQGDPTCLAVEWTPGEAAEEHHVRFVVAGMAGSFAEPLPDGASRAEFCAAEYPVVDGTTYHAEVISRVDGEDYASNGIPYTVDFDPPAYTATGTWKVTVGPPGWIFVSLDLVEVDGEITGSWTDASASGPLVGSRTYGAVELSLDRPDFRRMHVQFVEANQLEGILSPGATAWVTLTRD